MNLQQIIDEIFDHMRGMWRFRWVVLAISWVVALVAWYVVYTMPNIYEAAAKVSVDTNKLLPALTKGLTAGENLSLIHISEPTRQLASSRMPSSA